MVVAGAKALLMVVAGAVSTADAQSTTTVTAAWDHNTDALTTGYIVHYGTASGSYQWSYYLRARAVNAYGAGPASNVSCCDNELDDRLYKFRSMTA